MTAVEWLEQEIFRKYKFTLQQLNCQPLEGAIKQAKEMEKRQIIDTYLKGYNRAWNSETFEAEQYYNETFKEKDETKIKGL